MRNLLDGLADALGEKRTPELQYIEQRPRLLSPFTIAETKRLLKQWAAEGDRDAQEALDMLEERE